MRTPVFELHILPLFRVTDRDHMRTMIDLFDYDTVVEHANTILTRVEADMPTPGTGGPWPEEWAALFRRWRDTGFKRLALGQATYTIQPSGVSTVLIAQGQAPGTGFRAWLQVDAETDQRIQYVLFLEAPDSGGDATPTNFIARERLRAGEARSIAVRDASGVTVVR